MEPSPLSCQDNLLVEECEINQDHLAAKNSPSHFFPTKLKMFDVGSGDWEKAINQYYLGCDSENEDEWVLDEEQLQMDVQEIEDSIGSPIRINFCQTSDADAEVISIKSDSLSEGTNMVVSPLISKSNSPDLSEVGSVSSRDHKLVIFVEDENVVKSDGAVDISMPAIDLDKKCEVVTSPLQKCQPTIPFFVDSFDYEHKPGKLNIMNSFYAQRFCWKRKCSKIKKPRKRRRYRIRSIHSSHTEYTIRSQSIAASDTSCKKHSRRGKRGKNHVNKLQSPPMRTTTPYKDSPTPAANSVGKTISTVSLDSNCDIYKCPECDYSSNTMNEIIHHYCEKHFHLTCPKCDKSFGEPHFLQHCKNCSVSKAELKCDSCELTCTESSLLSLAMHIKFSHPIKKCVTCDEHFVPHKFIEHARTCFFKRKPECTCPFCEKELVYSQLSEHIVTHPIAECPLCCKDIVFDEAKGHIESCYLEQVNDSEESFGTVFSCPKCTLRFTFENMSIHIIQRHLSLNCVFCYIAISQEEMRQHIVLCCQKHQNLRNES